MLPASRNRGSGALKKVHCDECDKAEDNRTSPLKTHGLVPEEVHNTLRKRFQFGLKEATKAQAKKQLFEKIGKDAYK